MDDTIIIHGINNRNSIIIFGCGKNGKIIFKYLKKREKERKVICFADNNAHHLKQYKGIKIVKPEIAEKLCDKSLWIISSPQHALEMYQQLQKMHVESADIIQITEKEISLMYKKIHKYWYDEDRYFIYEYGFPINFGFITRFCESVIYSLYFEFMMKKSDRSRKKKYKYNVSICAIFLNESPYIKEWIEFHKMIGVEHFYLYNNMSIDDYQIVLKPYIKEGVVTLIDWNVPQGQISAYWDCVRRIRGESRWVGFIDLDEFVVPSKGKIYDHLKVYDYRCGAVLIYWKIFGGFEEDYRKLDGLVIEDFKRCWPKLLNSGKCFYNMEYSLSSEEKNGLGLHHICWTKHKNKDYPPINIYGKVSFPGFIQRADKKRAPVQINHYMIKSYGEFQGRIERPDSLFKINPRTKEGFREVDKRATGTDNLIKQYIPELKRRMMIGRS